MKIRRQPARPKRSAKTRPEAAGASSDEEDGRIGAAGIATGGDDNGRGRRGSGGEASNELEVDGRFMEGYPIRCLSERSITKMFDANSQARARLSLRTMRLKGWPNGDEAKE